MAANAHASRTVWHRADGRVGRRTHRAGYSGIHRPHSTMPHGLDGRWHRHGQRCRRCREPKHRSGAAEACATFHRLGAAGRNGGRHLPSTPRRLFPPRFAAYHGQTPQHLIEPADIFLQIYLWTLPGQYLLAIVTAVLRAVRSVRLPLVITLVTGLLNIWGDLAFGLGWWGFPHYGAAGLAWSTFVSVTLGACILFFALFPFGLLKH